MEIRAAFLASLDRVHVEGEADGLIRTFYDRFREESDEVAHAFRYTDVDRQIRMLRRSLELGANATIGDPEALAELAEQARTHGPGGHDIDPTLFDRWRETLMDCAATADPEWTPTVARAWERTLDHLVRHMLRHR